MDCPNGCDTMPQSCPIEVDRETYVENLAEHFGERRGIQACSPTETADGTPALLLTIDEDAYATAGHFKHRTQFENADNVTLNERSNSDVELVQHGAAVITAMECTSCGTVYDPSMEVVFDSPSKIY